MQRDRTAHWSAADLRARFEFGLRCPPREPDAGRADGPLAARPDRARRARRPRAGQARGWSELLSRPQADRVVLRAGRPIDRTLPDYRELDALLFPTGT